MPRLVTRFHLLLLAVTLAITAVGYFRIQPDFLFPAHWARSGADWLWPRDALLGAPALQIGVLISFFTLGRLLTRNHFAKVQHLLDPALTLVMTVIASCQLGLLLLGIGSDLDLIRFTGFGLAAVLGLVAVALFDAQRHTYAGLRMPWPIQSDRAWTFVHRSGAFAFGVAAIGLAIAAWFDAGPALFVLSFAAALTLPLLFCALLSLALRRR